MNPGFRTSWLGLAIAIAVAACLTLTGCGSGSDGSNGAPGASTGLLTGTVTNALTDQPCAGAEIAVDPAVGGPVTTGADGTYSVELPIGAYDVACTMPDYQDGGGIASVVAATTTTLDFALDPDSDVLIAISGAPSPGTPGGSYPLSATVTPMDGSTVTGYHWEQENSVAVTIENADSATPTVILPGADAYMEQLVEHTAAPERWDVLPVNPHQLEAAETVTLICTVTTTSGEYEESVDIAAHLDFGAWASGLTNVPVGVPVVMNGKSQGAYDWAIADAPAGSTATLNDATSKNPWFVPDVEGSYLISVTGDSDGPVGVVVWAGTWQGGIDGVLADEVPTMSCTSTCHGSTYREQFDSWAETGHAHIFSVNINEGGHYSSSCFSCHTVGFDTTADNNGMDDQSDYADFYATMWPGGHLTGDPGNFEQVLADWPNTARMTNIQCENCHGPNGSSFPSGHHQASDTGTRISARADVCGYCHGEPPRHGRFQQWEESAHGNYETAMSESSGSCNPCHTAQGYLNYYTRYLDPDNPAPSSISVAADEAHPVTCVVCHDPHNVGTVSGETTDAPMRVEDNAYNLAAGYDAIAVGKGAQCIVCHNGRRANRNDFVDWSTVSDKGRAPHGGPQGDLLLGMNAYFVDIGYRGPHSFLGDTCVTCHVELTDPPADFSYQLGGTNHSFEAKTSICGDCHGAYDGGTMKEAFDEGLEDMKRAIEAGILGQFEALTTGGYQVTITGSDAEEDGNPILLVVTDWTLILALEFSESHGRQAMNLVYDANPIYHVRLENDTDIQPSGGGASQGNMYDSPLWLYTPDEWLAKSGWNYFYLHSDGSHGFHNPGFATDVAVQTFYRLDALDWTMAP